MKTYYGVITVAISAAAAIAIVTPSLNRAQAAEQRSIERGVTQDIGGRAVPIQQIGEFDQVFTSRLNQAIAESGVKTKGTTIFSRSIFRSFITTCLYKCGSARLASKEELVKLRDLVAAEVKGAEKRKIGLSEVAKGQITNDFFVGTVHKVGTAAKAQD